MEPDGLARKSGGHYPGPDVRVVHRSHDRPSPVLQFSAEAVREFAPAVAGCLKEGKVEEAISVAEQNKRSHLAKVVEAGLQEFRAHGISHELAGEQIESSRRACERAEAIVNAELKRGLSGLATIGATAPFVGLFGTTVGIINAFQEMSSAKAAGLSAVAGGISEALVTTAFGLFVAVPAVWAYNIFTNKVEAFSIEMTQLLVRVDRLLHQAEEQQEVTLWEWVVEEAEARLPPKSMSRRWRTSCLFC